MLTASTLRLPQMIAELSDVSKIGEVFRNVLAVPLPITFPLESPRAFRERVAKEPREEVPPVVVAFTSFSVNGQQFKKDQKLNLNIGYDLEVEIALSRWPENEVDLRLEPLSVEPSETFNCASREMRTLSEARYSAQDDLLGSPISDPGSWRGVVPDTIGERLLNGVCSSN